MNRPGIYQLGTVTDDGETVTVSGWGLSWCATRCPCHLDVNGNLGIAATDDGTLGLVSHRACGCCRPWAVDEPQAVLRDVSDVGAMGVAG